MLEEAETGLSLFASLAFLAYWTGRWYKERYFREFEIPVSRLYGRWRAQSNTIRMAGIGVGFWLAVIKCLSWSEQLQDWCSSSSWRSLQACPRAGGGRCGASARRPRSGYAQPAASKERTVTTNLPDR